MTDENREKYLDIIDTIGIELVDILYNKLGPEKISMATLKKVIASHRIIRELNSKKSIKKLANDMGVSRMTIYRAMKKK